MWSGLAHRTKEEGFLKDWRVFLHRHAFESRTWWPVRWFLRLTPCASSSRERFLRRWIECLDASLQIPVEDYNYEQCQLHGHELHCQLHLWHSRLIRDFSPVRRERFGLRMKRVRTLLSGGRIHRCLVTCIISQVLFLHEPVMRKLTYVCTLPNAHT